MTFSREITTNTVNIYNDGAAVSAFGEVDDDYGCRYFGARDYAPQYPECP